MVDFYDRFSTRLRWPIIPSTLYLLLLTVSFKSFVLSTKGPSSIQRDKEKPRTRYQQFQRARIAEYLAWTARQRRSQQSISSSAITELVDFHNEQRRKENASNMIEMHWDSNLALNAQSWAEQCVFNNPKHYVASVVDQNIYLAPLPDEKHSPPNFTIAAVRWSRERANYRRKKGSCSSKSPCDNYLTMVKWNTIQIGCGMQICVGRNKDQTLFVVCEYFSRFTRSLVKPYLVGEPCSDCPDDFPDCNRGLCTGNKSMYPPWDIETVLSILRHSNVQMRGQYSTLGSSVILMTMLNLFLVAFHDLATWR